MANINDVIEVLELTNCQDHTQGGVVLDENAMNPVLVALGGKPVCVNESLPGAGDGTELHRVMLYAIALLAREVQK